MGVAHIKQASARCQNTAKTLCWRSHNGLLLTIRFLLHGLAFVHHASIEFSIAPWNVA